MQQTIPANDRVIATHVGTDPSTGPFTVDFPFFSLNDVVVRRLDDGADAWTILVRGADYDLAGVATEDGSFSSGTITLVLPVANCIISRHGNTTIERLSNFPLQGFFSRLALNAELNRITVVLQEHDGTIRVATTDLDRALQIPLSEAESGLVTTALPAASRANKFLVWDAFGNLAQSDKNYQDVENVDVSHFDELYVNVTGDSMSGPLSAPFMTTNQISIAQSMQVLTGGTAKAPTPGVNDVSTNLATTAWVVGFLGAQGQGEAVYKFGDATVSGDPGAGFMDIQIGVGTDRTISMSKLDADGVSRYLILMQTGDAMVVTNEFTPVTQYARYTLVSDVTDNGTWVQFNVHMNDSSNPAEAPPTGTRLRVTGFLNTMSGGASISGVSAGYGLTGGGSTGVIPIAADPTVLAPLANPVFTGDPRSTTPPTADNDTSIATTAFVKAQGYALTSALGSYLPLTGGSLTGPGNLCVAGTLGVTGAHTGTTITTSGRIKASNVAIPAGGTLGEGFMVSTTANWGIHFGSGLPNKAAAKGSLYLRSDGTGTPYYNSDGTVGGWLQIGAGGGSATHVGTTPPPTPTDGQLWFYSDASIGGGQLYIYYNDLFGSPQWVPASPGVGSGAVVQTVNYQTGAVATGTTVVPFDDTIPQIGEGNEYMTVAVTPRSATSKLVISVVAVLSSSVTGNIVVALFQDSTANALSAVMSSNDTATRPEAIPLTHTMTSGTTSTTTFRVRAGNINAGTTTFNGSGGTRLLGGVMSSSIVIQEVL